MGSACSKDDAKEDDLWKIVHSAARWQKMEDLKKIVKSPRRANLEDPQNGNYTLHIAAQNGHLPVVDFLLSRNANVNAQNKKGQTPLHSKHY
jgi:cyclin-dependent kinase inhibitor 2C